VCSKSEKNEYIMSRADWMHPVRMILNVDGLKREKSLRSGWYSGQELSGQHYGHLTSHSPKSLCTTTNLANSAPAGHLEHNKTVR